MDKVGRGVAGKDKGEKVISSAETAKNIPPLLAPDKFYSQLAGEAEVPLSFLKKNMGNQSSDLAYRYSGCYHTCRYSLLQSGFSPQGITSSKYMVDASFSGKKNTKSFKKGLSRVSEQAAEGKTKLDSLLNSGMPVIVGVNRNSEKHNARWTNRKLDGSLSPTDHFVVIVGRATLEDGSVAYRYFDPGRTRRKDSTNPNNLLIVKNGYIAGEGYKSVYTISEVRNTEK